MQNIIKINLLSNRLKHFQLIKRKNPNVFPMKFKLEFYNPQFIQLKIKKKIQQVGLEYAIFSKIVNIKI